MFLGERRTARGDRPGHARPGGSRSRRCSPRTRSPGRAWRCRPWPSSARTASSTSCRSGSREEFLYFAGSSEPGRIRPPNASASPDSEKIGNITRARNESCILLRRLRNASPTDCRTSGDAPRLARQRVPVVGRPAQLELAGDVAGQTTTTQIVARGACVRIGEQALVVPLDGFVHRLDELLAPGPLLRLTRRGVVELDPGLCRQVLDGAREVGVLDLLDEREDVAALVAAEALVAAGLLADVERRRSSRRGTGTARPSCARRASARRTAGPCRRSTPSSAAARCPRRRSP